MNCISQAVKMVRCVLFSDRITGATEKNTAAVEANTQAIMASSESIKRRSDEFGRLIHGLRGEALTRTKPKPKISRSHR